MWWCVWWWNTFIPIIPLNWIQGNSGVLYFCKKEGLCWFAVCIIEQEIQLRGQNVAYDDPHISKEVLVDWLPLSRGNREPILNHVWKNEIVLFGYFWNQPDSPVHNPYNVFPSILFFLAFSPFLASVAAFVGVGSRLVGFDPNWHWQRGR